MTAANANKSTKCVVLLATILVAGCNMGISEEGKDRCLGYARYQKNDFVAKKIYERCLKTVMVVLRREEEAEKKRKAEQDRLDALSRLRSEVRLRQYRKFEKYKDWQYWPNRLTIDNSSPIAASCIALTESGTSTEVITSLEDTDNNFMRCGVSDSLYFTEKGFRLASIFSHKIEGEQQFDIIEHDIDCRFLAQVKYRNVATILGKSSYGVFKQIGRFTDPFSRKDFLPTFSSSVSVWPGEWRKSQGASKEMKENMINPFCELHTKFWSESGESFVKSLAI